MQNQSQTVSATGEPRLLDRIRNKCRLLHYSIRTESAYVDWVTRVVRFHRLQDGTWPHPTDLTGPAIGRFLTHLAVDANVSASTQTQALCAIVFMYRQVLEIDPGNIDGMRAQKPDRLPTVLSVSEVRLTSGSMCRRQFDASDDRAVLWHGNEIARSVSAACQGYRPRTTSDHRA